VSAADLLPAVVPNQNHSPAGVLRDGVLTVRLEIAKGEWHPEADDGIALAVYAFGEAGGVLQNPGPLLRVPRGTEIRASVHNTLAVPVSVHGLGDSSTGGAVLHIAPGMTEQVRFKAVTPGLFCYWGATEVEELKLRFGIDSELTGAFVIDPPDARSDEEIFVMELMSEHPGGNARQTLATINGKSWPYTQRFQYEVGQPVRWRWINATNEPHALHLHGFYYRIDALKRDGRVESYSGESRPTVVTQRIAQGETFDMSWSPDRPGRWLFHCHMVVHMIPPMVPSLPDLSVLPAPVSADEHAAMNDAAGMGQLVLGITVPQSGKKTKAEWHAERNLQLEISERSGAPRYALQLRERGPVGVAPSKPGLIGPPIVLARGEPVEIGVFNKLKQPTAIHWHGIELERLLRRSARLDRRGYADYAADRSRHVVRRAHDTAARWNIYLPHPLARRGATHQRRLRPADRFAAWREARSGNRLGICIQPGGFRRPAAAGAHQRYPSGQDAAPAGRQEVSFTPDQHLAQQSSHAGVVAQPQSTGGSSPRMVRTCPRILSG
jgi:FtsP/CotA-like multicopper oxidase with cupredoxin domain